ncbi:STAS domain-containing protein [Paracoccus tegillarcae]|uniref:Anti-sigma factor antagonist n=1 Tax=Paracoccus tegillarcae TaxID=1529068 RepID=A0A2K9EYI0_9RHOB|nr:STAS domain-containing protein [Paracoccus tegillarcae]AUH33162.1 anti-sigma factor antagonist [Paracoccus tegillarcae]
MNLTVTSDTCKTVVKIEDRRLDAAISTRFKDRMRQIVSKCKNQVTLDMRQVDFMDSSGLGAMIAVHKAMPAGVPLILSGLTPNVGRVFKLTRMDTVFVIEDSSDLKREAG